MGSLTLTNWFRGEKVFKLSRKYGGYFRNEADHRDFVSIGTAAGVLLISSTLQTRGIYMTTQQVPIQPKKMIVCVYWWVSLQADI